VDFSPSIGNEMHDEHPALAVSADLMNLSPFGMLVVIPVSSSSPPPRIHVDVPAGEGGLKKPSRIKCDQIGKADIRRFRDPGRLGRVSAATVAKVEHVLRRILEL
jgi:mRNA interferase MazF